MSELYWAGVGCLGISVLMVIISGFCDKMSISVEVGGKSGAAALCFILFVILIFLFPQNSLISYSLPIVGWSLSKFLGWLFLVIGIIIIAVKIWTMKKKKESILSGWFSYKKDSNADLKPNRKGWAVIFFVILGIIFVSIGSKG